MRDYKILSWKTMSNSSMRERHEAEAIESPSIRV